MFEEEIFERIDSNILFAMYSYLSRDSHHVQVFISALGAKIQEFTRKCSRLLQIYITPYVDPTLKMGIRIRNKSQEEVLEEMRFLEHKGQLWPLHVQPCLKMLTILATESALFTFVTLTGARHPGELVPGEDHEMELMKKRVLGRTILGSYLGSMVNEKAAQISLSAVVCFVKSQRRWR